MPLVPSVSFKGNHNYSQLPAMLRQHRPLELSTLNVQRTNHRLSGGYQIRAWPYQESRLTSIPSSSPQPSSPQPASVCNMITLRLPPVKLLILVELHAVIVSTQMGLDKSKLIDRWRCDATRALARKYTRLIT